MTDLKLKKNKQFYNVLISILVGAAGQRFMNKAHLSVDGRKAMSKIAQELS